MTNLKKIKEMQVSARRKGDKPTAATLTMLISRADRERVNLGLMSVDDISNAQLERIINAELKQLSQEAEYLSEGLDANLAARQLLESFLPAPATDEQITLLAEAAVNMSIETLPAAIECAKIIVDDEYSGLYQLPLDMKRLVPAIKKELERISKD